VLAGRIEHPDVRAVGGLDHAAMDLLSLLQPGDVLLTMGAGDGYKVGEMILEKFKAQSEAYKLGSNNS
jgi:UDP-N-acetylmuramate--alanine ligase